MWRWLMHTERGAVWWGCEWRLLELELKKLKHAYFWGNEDTVAFVALLFFWVTGTDDELLMVCCCAVEWSQSVSQCVWMRWTSGTDWQRSEAFWLFPTRCYGKSFNFMKDNFLLVRLFDFLADVLGKSSLSSFISSKLLTRFLNLKSSL